LSASAEWESRGIPSKLTASVENAVPIHAVLKQITIALLYDLEAGHEFGVCVRMN
jgi:hypothetical protein